MKLSHFPTLIPAFTAQIQIDTPLAITPSLLNIPFLPYSGSLTSAPGYPYQINARFIHGSDYLRLDPDEQHVRLDVRATAQDKHTGALLLLVYHGVVDITGAEGLVIRGDENAHTTGFGNAFVQVRFETDDDCLVPIEDKMYVGSGRFIVEEGQPIIVEYKISEVAAACEDRI
ncbi:hypothetical protein NLU13_3879 [Sarocladium strictum]|uniref:Uncharacterized protein n=1 Tax=Sarocladium strictum TaxID=5046 RepID=A0AA39L846_SARSR|nr:hypothetical protein NLU13_3879 [Sarocladium strictum]